MIKLGFVWLAATLVACSGQVEPLPDTLRQAVRDGMTDDDPTVVALLARRTSCDGSPPELRCSGTVIGEHWVLTAAHCVAGVGRGDLEVFFGQVPGQPGGSYRGVGATFAHPAYDRQFDDNDIALVWLNEPAPVTGRSLVDFRADESWLGRTAQVVGFGGTGVAGSELATKRDGSVTLTDLGEHTLSYGAAPSMTCPGDSGGPVFVQVDGTQTLVGVTTSGDAQCKTLGVATRIDQHLASFIEPTLASVPIQGMPAMPEALCSAGCNDDRDCPADLVCRADSDGRNRCLVPKVGAGNFGAVCQSDAECTLGPCVPLGDACQCLEPCAQATAQSKAGAGNAGCQMSRAPSCWSAWAIATAAAAAWGRRKRRRAGAHHFAVADNAGQPSFFVSIAKSSIQSSPGPFW